jgi:hypothetical protein
VGFIREYDFLMREGWMDGGQSGKNNEYVLFSEKMVIPVLGKNTQQNMLQRKSVALRQN